MTNEQTNLLALIDQSARRAAAIAYEGYAQNDQNLPEHILVVESPSAIYSFPKTDLVEQESLPSGRVRVWVRVGASAFRMSAFTIGGAGTFTVGMENIAPPPPNLDPDAPQHDLDDQSKPDRIIEASTLASAYAAFSQTPTRGSCVGGDSYENNCAHFLSDAFIRAGFSELLSANPHINARCGTSAKRPIRARDMWSWFQSKAARSSRSATRNTGMWAVFQLKESVYWGGHVCLLDTDGWKWKGTGYFPDWDQYLYQW